ncbi:MAG: hypothetical protein UX13_C0009G0015 [Candidatus Woesebacteria bacterium GW2011_GWB1_45_5]|uniref:Uncharacterized protein n=1 Tax=Candidatus Woesebacteria bacterium GW2011_GWB1_45_5 TaxID=1618581 RepID=A0A0G1PYM0_9BACT|nr:MAG: hypothetical protein UX13_C0009G0015 [Candidatus Woesebacteria bacterium GW2011_GWB1_45_5]
MTVYGALGKFLSFGNDAILKILFLFPSLALSLAGPVLLVRYLKFDKVVQFFAALVYVFNTYYILLVDGGQVGVALAYGIFPFAVLFLKKLTDRPGYKTFFSALLFGFVLCLADPRIFAVAFAAVFLWSLLEKKFPAILLPLGLTIAALNLYWILPLLNAGSISVPPGLTDLKLTRLINPLVLFSPHWPDNIFGRVISPKFYFALVPVLILGSFLFNRKNIKFALLFLFFSLLFVVPLGWVFRDPTKFFMPVILFAGILIGRTVEAFPKIKIPAYLYILFLISPAISGKLNFLLSAHTPDPSYKTVYEELKKDGSEFRTVWFTRKHPLSYETKGKPAIDAGDLASFRPFAAMNASEDVFNFLNNPEFTVWLKVLGIKYVFLNGDARNILPTEKDNENWGIITWLVGQSEGLDKKSWGTSFEAFEVPGVFPKTFYADKLFAVVGQDLTGTAPAVYFEDGKWDPGTLKDKDPGSVDIIFNGKDKTDLAMSFLQKYFVPARKNIANHWAIYTPDQYLKYKYELLIRGFKFNDFDYGHGIAFSSVAGEGIKFRLDVPSDGKYILALRKANSENQSLLWSLEEKDLKKGSFDYEVVSNSGLEILNVIALVPKQEFDEVSDLAAEFTEKFGAVNASKPGNAVAKDAGSWKVTTTSFNPDENSLPVYSMVNGYYIKPQ